MIRELCITDEDYPEKLKNIENPPQKLYYKGDVSLLAEKTVAVVGSRKFTAYGRWVAENIGRKMARGGVVLASGLAAGIDTFGHRGVLEEGGRTVAVLGCGIDLCYPSGNKELKRKIEKTGLVISEYPPGFTARKYTFPERNRIISGISDLVVVVEAGFSSGSLITAEYAMEQGRALYGVPGNITSRSSMGTNKLIQDGATPLVVIDDLFRELNVEYDENAEEIRKLGKDEIAVYNILKNFGEQTIDQVADKVGFSSAKVMGITTILEIKGIVETCFGKIFIRK